MLAWLRGHETVIWWLGALSVVTCVGTLVVLPLVVARLPADYCTHAQVLFLTAMAKTPAPGERSATV
jgi:hypothetical protein